MGAGVVKPQPGGRGFEIHINTRAPMSRNQEQTTGSLKCEECSTVFSAFKKRKQCKDCARDFCSSCTVQVNGSSPRQQQCLKCQTLLSGNFTRSQISTWRVKDLKALLTHQNVNTAQCREKKELIDLVVSSFCGNIDVNQRATEEEQFVQNLRERMRLENESNSQPNNTGGNRDNSTTETTNQTSPTTTNQTHATTEATNRTQSTFTTSPNFTPSPANGSAAQLEAQRLQERRERELREAQANNQTEGTQEEEEGTDWANNNPRLQLDDIKSEEEIESLNIKSLKRLLLNNFVDYKGCCERWELQERVKRLWQDNEVNKKKAEDQRQMSDNPSSSGSLPGAIPGEEDICKICMDATIDCVLLECGHMVTCTKCGKRLAECPICRQYVVRAVHTFRS